MRLTAERAGRRQKRKVCRRAAACLFQPPTEMPLNTHAATSAHTPVAGAAAKNRAHTHAPARQTQAVMRLPRRSTM
jgi:hypothetical protein